MRILEKNSQVLNHLDGYQQLEVLSISCLESLRSLPNSLGQLVNVKTLLIDNGNGCSMNPTLPESIGNLQALEKLVLFGRKTRLMQAPNQENAPPFPRVCLNSKI